jgi:crossover junction endodeoxyribonuclease RuvC/BirA family biotin operon repressor/biotin-[acetyl-CoA-carboxylase] ligase
MPRYFKYAKGSIPKARKLRREMTDAERKIWSRLRGEQLGVQFRRQAPVGPYIVDFLCIKRRLVVEIDGGQHYTEEGEAYDNDRTAYLEAEGLRVVRVSNREALTNADGVVQMIYELLHEPLSDSPLLGERTLRPQNRSSASDPK